MGGRGVLLDPAVLDKVLDGVQPEAVGAHILQPEAGRLLHGFGDLRVGQVQVGHPFPEDAVVVFLAAGRGAVPDALSPGAGVAGVVV